MNNTDSKLRYCLYARKSSESDDRQVMSIDSQTTEMQSLAARERLDVVVVKTEAHSAKLSGERPVFREMLSDITKGTYDAILTWAPDRLSRNAGDLGQLVDLMDQAKLREIRTNGTTFTNSPNDKFLLMILCSQAKLENDNKGVNVSRGLRARVEMGLWPCVAPFGYKNSELRGREGHIEVDEERAPLVKEAFAHVVDQGWSGHEVYHWLRETGVQSRGGKEISLSCVQDIFRRPMYAGKFEWPKRSGKWYVGVHEPLIDWETYELAQKRIAEHARARLATKEPVKSAPLARLMRCGRCGSGVCAQEKRKPIRNGTIATYVYYGCTRGKDRRCKNLALNEKEVIPQIAAIIDQIDLDLIGTRKYVEHMVEKVHAFRRDYYGIPIPERGVIEKERDLRLLAKGMLEHGTVEEKKGILELMRGRLVLLDKKVLLA